MRAFASAAAVLFVCGLSFGGPRPRQCPPPAQVSPGFAVTPPCVCGDGCRCAPGKCPTGCPVAAPQPIPPAQAAPAGTVRTNEGRLIRQTPAGWVFADEGPAAGGCANGACAPAASPQFAPAYQPFVQPGFGGCAGGACGAGR